MANKPDKSEGVKGRSQAQAERDEVKAQQALPKEKYLQWHKEFGLQGIQYAMKQIRDLTEADPEKKMPETVHVGNHTVKVPEFARVIQILHIGGHIKGDLSPGVDLQARINSLKAHKTATASWGAHNR